MQNWKEKFNDWWYYQVEHRIAYLAIAVGVLRSRTAFLIMCEIAPGAVGLALLLNEMRHDAFAWFFDEDGQSEAEGEVPKGLMDGIEEKILRAPSPMGADEYLITMQRRGLLPGETHAICCTSEEISEGLSNRPLIATDSVAGDRYYDWRKGRGREETERLLRRAAPTPEAPVTLIMVAFTGKAVVRIDKATSRGKA